MVRAEGGSWSNLICKCYHGKSSSFQFIFDLSIIQLLSSRLSPLLSLCFYSCYWLRAYLLLQSYFLISSTLICFRLFPKNSFLFSLFFSFLLYIIFTELWSSNHAEFSSWTNVLNINRGVVDCENLWMPRILNFIVLSTMLVLEWSFRELTAKGRKKDWKRIKIESREICLEAIVGLNERWWDLELRLGKGEKDQ